MAEQSSPTRAHARDTLREIPLSRIVVAEGFNPRGDVVDDRALDQLAETMRQRGCLQPIRVRATGDGDYVLVAGERRYRAAVKAALTVLPAVVRPAGGGDDDEAADLLTDAMIENEAREDFSRVRRALGYRRMLDGGLTVKGVAERLGGIPQTRIRDHLAILDLPEDLWPKVDDATIPMGAVKALGKLAKVHSGLPGVAVQRVLGEPTAAWARPTTWDDVAEDPVAVVAGSCDGQAADLPADVYVGGAAYPLSRFTLSDKARTNLGKIAKLRTDVDVETLTIHFDRTLVEQAATLKAAHASREGHAHLIVGNEVADLLVEVAIARQLKEERAVARRARELAERSSSETPTTPLSEEELRERDRQEREARRAARDAAAARNEELGAAVVSHLSKTKVDARVVKVLAAFDVNGELGQIAARGARYGFPGWPIVSDRAGGGTKRAYLPQADAATKAREYLAGAKSANDIAGRLLALLVMARLADEGAALDRQHTGYRLSAATYTASGVPWQDDAVELLDELARERLPEHITESLRTAQD